MSGIARGLFGGGSNAGDVLKQFSPGGFGAPGATGSFADNTFTLTRSPEGNTAISNLVGGFEARSKEFAGLRKDVKPGFGALTRERVRAIRESGSRTVGNLREELGKRRVLGSSFGQDLVTRTELDFANAEKTARAEGFLEELAATRQLIADQFDAAIGGAQALLEQLNFETNLAAKLGDSASRQVNQNLIAQAEATAAAEAGAFEFLGTVIGGAFDFFKDIDFSGESDFDFDIGRGDFDFGGQFGTGRDFLTDPSGGSGARGGGGGSGPGIPQGGR